MKTCMGFPTMAIDMIKTVTPKVVRPASAQSARTIASAQTNVRDSIHFTGQPAKEKSTGFFAAIGNFIKDTFNLIFVRPFRWLGEKLGLVSKTKSSIDKPQPVSDEDFHSAIEKGTAEEVEAMLKNQPDLINSVLTRGETPLIKAVTKTKDSKMINVLLDSQSDLIDQLYWRHKSSILHKAVREADQKAEVIETLLARKPQLIDAVTETSQDSVLHNARNPEVVKVLLAKKPELINAVDIWGGSVLHRAVGGNADPEVIKALLVAKPKLIDAVDNDGDSVLHYAASYTHNPAVIDTLLAAKPGLSNAKGKLGYSVLHSAARNSNHTEVFEKLLKAKPELINAKDAAGYTPYDIANQINNIEACHALEDYMDKHGLNKAST